MTNTWIASVLAVTIAAWGGGFSAIAAGDEPYSNDLSRTTWAEKLPGGPIKILFIAPYVALHDSYELAQRFEIDGVHVATTQSESNAWPSGAKRFGIKGHYWPELLRSSEQVLGQVREALHGNWQVLALGHAPLWSEYPQDIREYITSAVAGGRSLVTYFDEPIEKDFARAGTLQEMQIGAERFGLDNSPGRPRLLRYGRGYVMDFRVKGSATRFQFIPYSGDSLSDFEYSAARAGWYLRLAARPHTQLAIRAARFAEGHLTVETTVNRAIDGSELQVAVRRRQSRGQPEAFGQYLFKTKKKVKRDATITLARPQLPAGQYHAELRVVNRRGETLDWDTIRFSLESPAKLKAVTVNRKTVEAGEPVECELELDGPTQGLQVTVRWYDNWNRLLIEKSFEKFTGRFDLTAPAGSRSVLNHIQVTLDSKRGPEAIAAAQILMPQNVRSADDFYVLYWPGWEGHKYLQIDALRRRGAADAITNCAVSENIARNAALHHLRTVPYTTSFHNTSLDNLLVNEDWMSEMEAQARSAARAHSPYNTLAYTLGDENYMSAFTEQGRFLDHPMVWQKFGAFLGELYPDIGSLNLQWGSSFADFGAIRFKSEKQMLGSLDNPSAWVDFRFFVERHWAQAHQRMREAIRQEHPSAMVGFDGAEQYSSYDGYDWFQLVRNMDMVNVYSTYFLPGVYSNKIFNGQAAQSFATNAVMKGCWMNGVDFRYGGRYVPWYSLLNGWSSVWWWLALMHPANGALQWNLEPTPIVKDMVEAAREIKSGPATLLAHAEKQMDPIAVHYSSANWHASTIESGIGNHVNNLGLAMDLWMANSLNHDEQQQELWGRIRPKGHYAAASKSFYLLLQDMGFQPRTMARQEIEQGELTKAHIKVLVLPFVVSLSDKEAENIRAFVETGGMIVADYRCGLRDMHGKLRQTGVLDDVFGITRKSLDVTRKRQTVVFNRTDTGMGGKLESVFHEDIAADTATSYGYHDDGSPALFVHFREGGVRSIYFNFDLYAYEQMRREGAEHDVREALRYLLMSASGGTGPFVQAPFVPESEHGHPLGRIQVTRFRDRQTSYFGVLPDFSVYDKAPVTASLPFPTGKHVYDVRGKRYLGSGGMIRDVLQPGRPAMYAALPYKVTGVSADCPNSIRRGQRLDVVLRIRGTVETLGPHAVRVEVAMPDGTKPEYLPKTIYLPGGEGRYSFTPALNAPKGMWQVAVTECVSGISAEATIDMR